jgi:hypothetical protein
MKKFLLPIVAIPAFLVCGCTMFSAWKSIPPPGGCDQCHTVAISNDWRVSYQAPMLTDERSRGEYFQSAQTTMPVKDKPLTPLDLRKVEDSRCFECHRAPTPKHLERKGRYHH